MGAPPPLLPHQMLPGSPPLTGHREHSGLLQTEMAASAATMLTVEPGENIRGFSVVFI